MWNSIGFRMPVLLTACLFGPLGGLNECDSDRDGDEVLEDGDMSGVAGDSYCQGGVPHNCDDNCPTALNSNQADTDNDGVGDACDFD